MDFSSRVPRMLVTKIEKPRQPRVTTSGDKHVLTRSRVLLNLRRKCGSAFKAVLLLSAGGAKKFPANKFPSKFVRMRGVARSGGRARVYVFRMRGRIPANRRLGASVSFLRFDIGFAPVCVSSLRSTLPTPSIFSPRSLLDSRAISASE